MEDFKVFTGNSNPELAIAVVEHIRAKGLDGFHLGKAHVGKFKDGEIRVEIRENVRGQQVYVIQSTCQSKSNSCNDNLMELLIMLDALRRSSAQRITVVIPYYGYARQDRKTKPRVPITAKLVADLISNCEVKKVLATELHAGQIQGFFNIPVDNLFAKPVFLGYIKNINAGRDLVMVSPDAGGVERARSYAKELDCGLAIIDKRRIEANESEVMNVIGEVKSKTAVILDDMIDTAGTLTQAAAALKKKEAASVYACCVHAVFSGPALGRLEKSDLEEVVVTDTIPLKKEAKKSGKIKVLSIAHLIGETILRDFYSQSVSSLFV